MMRPDADVAVYVCIMPVDMRKQATTLALLVEQALKRNIFDPALYVFSNQRRDRIKILPVRFPAGLGAQGRSKRFRFDASRRPE